MSKIKTALNGIITDEFMQIVNEIKISDHKKTIKYIELSNGSNIFDLADEISSIAKEYDINKENIYIASVSEVGSYDSSSSLSASFETLIKKSEKEIGLEFETRISSYAYQILYKKMTEAGFKRVAFDTSLLKDFKDTSVAQMIKSKDHSRLVVYYSLYYNE